MPEWIETQHIKILMSLLLVLASIGLKLFAVHRIKSWNIRSIEFRRKWMIQARALSVLVLAAGLVLIWSTELKTIAFSLVALAVAIAIGTKELLMCLMGSFLKTSTRAFRLGDRIKVGDYQGDVVDHGMMTTSILEIGPDKSFTGRWITIPNSLYLSHPVSNSSLGQHHCLHCFEISFDQVKENWIRAYEILKEAVKDEGEPYEKTVGKIIQTYAQSQAIELPPVRAEINLDLSRNGFAVFRCRIPCRMDEKKQVEERILERLLTAYESEIIRKDFINA
ncbi:MAG: hypothetical protein EA369_10035 [Bradymonadales bacterium]|nr:MAG: hypothetical protein EA369_10035 [Bradymonadales bacterium]